MAVISISVTESREQIIYGIPRTVSVTTNVPTTIFYTLDGTDPTLFSDIYTSPIELPTNELKVILKLFASNGSNVSDISSFVYQSVQLGHGTRTPHSGTNASPNSVQNSIDPYPFGSPPIMPNQIFLGTAAAGFTTNDPALPSTPTGFNAVGDPTGQTNVPFIGIPSPTLPVILSTTNAQGETGPNIGTLPKSTVQQPIPPPEQSNSSDKLFNPKAMVIFQDFTKPQDPNLPVTINREHFTLEDVEHTRQGNQFFNTGLDTPGPTGSFLRSHYNPTDQTITYYYFDSSVNRWIISKTAFTPSPNAGRFYNMVFSKEKGAGFVFQWTWNRGTYLY